MSDEHEPEVEGASAEAVAGETETTEEADYSGPTWNIRLLRNGDFPAAIDIPEGSTGRDLTNFLLENRDPRSGNLYLSGANPEKQTYLDDSGHAYGPNDTLADGLMLNSVSKLGGASA